MVDVVDGVDQFGVSRGMEAPTCLICEVVMT